MPTATKVTAVPVPVPPSIDAVLSNVMDEITSVGKTGWNTHSQYKFRGIDAVINQVGPAFRKHRVKAIPIMEDITYQQIYVGANKTPMQQVTVKVRYRFRGPGGDFEDAVVPGEAFDSGDKATAKAMSVAYRTALIQVLCLPTDEPDPDQFTYDRAEVPVTDPKWLNDVRRRIDCAENIGQLDQIGAEIGQRANDGVLADEDGTDLRARFDARAAALRDEDPWQKPAPQPAAKQTRQRPAGRPAQNARNERAAGQRNGNNGARSAEQQKPAGPPPTLPKDPDTLPAPDAGLVDQLAEWIQGATTSEQLTEVGLTIKEEQDRGNLTQAQADNLRKQYKHRQNVVNEQAGAAT